MLNSLMARQCAPIRRLLLLYVFDALPFLIWSLELLQKPKEVFLLGRALNRQTNSRDRLCVLILEVLALGMDCRLIDLLLHQII